MIFSVGVFVRTKTYGANTVYFHFKTNSFTLQFKFGNFENHSWKKMKSFFDAQSISIDQTFALVIASRLTAGARIKFSVQLCQKDTFY